jgi:hypothetical protein
MSDLLAPVIVGWISLIVGMILAANGSVWGFPAVLASITICLYVLVRGIIRVVSLK